MGAHDVPRLVIVDVVTREHGETYAEELDALAFASGAPVEAFGLTGVVEWPDERAGQARFHEIEDGIAGRVFDELRPVVTEAFVRIAGEVLARERSREVMSERPTVVPPRRPEPRSDEALIYARLCIRVMERLTEAVAVRLEAAGVYDDLYLAYVDLLQEELAPYAFDLAYALFSRTEWAVRQRQEWEREE